MSRICIISQTAFQRRRADGLNFVRAEAGKEAVKQLVPVLDLFEELEAKYAGVSDENSLKVRFLVLLCVFILLLC